MTPDNMAETVDNLTTTAVPTPPPASSGKMTFAEKMQVADIIVKWLGAAAVLIGAYLGVVKYFQDQEASRQAAKVQAEIVERQAQKDSADRKARDDAELKQRQKEFNMKFYEQQINLYAALCDAVARVATAETLAEAKEDLRTFYVLYWGKVSLVESDKVEKAQRRVYDALIAVDNVNGPPPSELRSLSYELAHTCRDELRQVFDSTIGVLTPARSDLGTKAFKVLPGGKAGSSK